MILTVCKCCFNEQIPIVTIILNHEMHSMVDKRKCFGTPVDHVKMDFSWRWGAVPCSHLMVHHTSPHSGHTEEPQLCPLQVQCDWVHQGLYTGNPLLKVVLLKRRNTGSKLKTTNGALILFSFCLCIFIIFIMVQSSSLPCCVHRKGGDIIGKGDMNQQNQKTQIHCIDLQWFHW